MASAKLNLFIEADFIPAVKLGFAGYMDIEEKSIEDKLITESYRIILFIFIFSNPQQFACCNSLNTI